MIITVFRIADDHFASNSKLLISISTNNGKCWHEPQILSELNIIDNSSSWNCPSISYISNNKIILCCEENIKAEGALENEKSFRVRLHFWDISIKREKVIIKENWIVEDFNVFGFNPDRILPLPDGKWLLGWHFYGSQIVINGKAISDNPNLIQCVSFSDNYGRSWHGHRIIADKLGVNLCDGNIIYIDRKKIGCFMRDHSFNGAPSQVSFSEDFGYTWSEPVELPFSGHHNITKKISDNIFFSFYRNVKIRGGNICKDDIGVWGTFFDINDFSRYYSFEIENDGTLWQNCGWGDTIADKMKLYCFYYLTGNKTLPVIRMAEISYKYKKLKRLLNSKGEK